jgi:hypothetical protein
MSGYPQFNFPVFHEATAALRKQGWDVVSPAELDAKAGIAGAALASERGDPNDLPDSWGTILARDVKLIADGGIEAIVFLPGWEKSRGALLEGTIGLLQKGFKFFDYTGPDSPPREIPRVNRLRDIHTAMVHLT